MQVLRTAFPDHALLGEEGGISGDTGSEYLWCVDPLDGTTNFAHGYPSFAVSVAGKYSPSSPQQLETRRLTWCCLSGQEANLHLSSNCCMWALFVAVLQKGDPVAGVVVEFAGGPGSWVTKTYTAAKGKGASLNGSPISVSRCKDVNLSLLVLLFCFTPPNAIAVIEPSGQPLGPAIIERVS